MVLWEIMVLMITVTLCVCAGVRIIVESILNAIEKYKAKRAAKVALVLNEVAVKIPEIVDNVEKKRKEQQKE